MLTEAATLYGRLRAAARLEARELVHRLRLPVSYRLRMIADRPGAVQNMALLAADRSYLYVPVFKAANTAIRQVLWGLANVPLADTEMGRAYRETGPFTDLASLSQRELRSVFKGPSTFRFTFVRNPYSRLLSAYRNKIAARPEEVSRYLENLGWPAEAQPTFEAFVRRVASQRDVDKDAHWLPQHRAAFMDFVAYDFVGRVETSEADLAQVLGRIGGSNANLPGRLNPSSNLEGGAYTDELAELVYRTYRKDFELFGYDRGSYRSE